MVGAKWVLHDQAVVIGPRDDEVDPSIQQMKAMAPPSFVVDVTVSLKTLLQASRIYTEPNEMWNANDLFSSLPDACGGSLLSTNL